MIFHIQYDHYYLDGSKSLLDLYFYIPYESLIFTKKSDGFYSYLISIVIGGSLGNLFDRIYYYAVPDFIDIHIGRFHWFVFNVADIFITIGIIGLVLIEFTKNKKITDNV